MDNLEQTVIEVDARSKSNTKRLDKLEQTITALNDLAISVRVMASKMDTISDSVNKLDGKVEALEAKPGKRYDGLVEKIIWACVAAGLTYVLSHIGL